MLAAVLALPALFERVHVSALTWIESVQSINMSRPVKVVWTVVKSFAILFGDENQTRASFVSSIDQRLGFLLIQLKNAFERLLESAQLCLLSNSEWADKI